MSRCDGLLPRKLVIPFNRIMRHSKHSVCGLKCGPRGFERTHQRLSVVVGGTRPANRESMMLATQQTVLPSHIRDT